MYGKTKASGLTEFSPFIFTSAIWGHSCFLVHLASCIPPAPQQSSWRVAASDGSQFWGALIHIWKPEITDSCDISHLLIQKEIFSFHAAKLREMYRKERFTCVWRLVGWRQGSEGGPGEAICPPVGKPGGKMQEGPGEARWMDFQSQADLSLKPLLLLPSLLTSPL